MGATEAGKGFWLFQPSQECEEGQAGPPWGGGFLWLCVVTEPRAPGRPIPGMRRGPRGGRGVGGATSTTAMRAGALEHTAGRVVRVPAVPAGCFLPITRPRAQMRLPSRLLGKHLLSLPRRAGGVGTGWQPRAGLPLPIALRGAGHGRPATSATSPFCVGGPGP